MVEHMENLPQGAGQRWILVEHAHPESNLVAPFPSGVQGDFEVLLGDYGETNISDVLEGHASTAITRRISARIRYRDPVSGRYHYTTYGYDPGRYQIGAFFVEVETETGALVDYSFKDIKGIGAAKADYDRHMAGISRGTSVVKATP